MTNQLPAPDEAVHYLTVAILSIVKNPDDDPPDFMIADAVTAIADYAAARATARKDLATTPPPP